jgi:small subunit ribosomal protein S20
MPNIRSAYKRLRQDKKKHERNKAVKSELHTLIKKAQALIDEKKREEADVTLKKLESKMDKAAKSDIIKDKKASRQISRLRQHWSQIG